MRGYRRFLLIIYLAFANLAQAQISTTPNLINPDGTAWGIPQNQILNNNGISQVEGAGPTSGTAYYNSDTNTIRFSYLPSTVAQIIAINQALQGTGIQINGFNWYYLWMNGGWNTGTLTGSIVMNNSSNVPVETHTFNHPIQPDGSWYVESGTRTFTNPYALSSVSTITMTFSGQDDRYWNGLYGPRVRNPQLSLNYSVDQCLLNPLSSPDCPGYATAYFNQQCTISPLYNPSCPGYVQAFHDQQCMINPLYATDCPGYQQAYFDYQCQQNGLYSTSCPNYADAYAKKQLLAQLTTDTTITTTTSTTATFDPVTGSTGSTATMTNTTAPVSVVSPTSVISGGTTSATTTITTTSNTLQSTPTQTAPAPTADSKATAQEIRSATAGSTDNGTARARVEQRAKEAAKTASEAKTLESQAKTQGLVVGLMGFVPGFDAYSSARIVDINAMEMSRQYSRPNVDNRSVLRQLNGANDQLHQDMVDQQYNRSTK